ncbi:MAG: peptidylprolyl isomerase [Gammaproteobacteria bacterium]|nr:MAG: peptidylprolyl isomerase [Gammaproteobacteria bacterium]
MVVLAASTSIANAERVADVDSIVAVVNDDVILQSELEGRINNIKERLARENKPFPPEQAMQKQVLESVILERLQLQAADRTGVRIDDNTLNKAIAGIARRNNVTLEILRSTLETDGVDFEEYREGVRKQMTLNRLRQRQVVSRISISDSEAENFIKQNLSIGKTAQEYRIGQILVAVPEAASPEKIAKAKAKANKILKKLQAGEFFQQLAMSTSDGRQALEGGDLGWRKLQQVPSLFVDAVAKMQAGDISPLIRSPSGFHIIKILEVRGGEQHFVKQTQVRHILLKTNEITSDEDARIRLGQLRIRLQGGDDFSELARSHSQDTGSAIKGGMLGWVSPGDLVPQFEKVMNEIALNDISEPFKSSFGWHILQVLGRRQQDDTQAFRKGKARQYLRERRIEEDTENWLRRLRDEAYVNIRAPEEY